MHKLIGGAVLAAGLAMPAHAWVSVHVETSAATQARIASGGVVENFDAAASGNFRSTLGTPDFGATFAGFALNGADANGDAFGGSKYVSTTGSARVTLDRAAQYLSFRTAALDGNDTIELFSKGTSLGTWNLVDSAAAAGFAADPSRYSTAFTYVDFFTDEGFDEVRFTQSAGRFAMDDFTVSRIAAVPEAQTWALLILGFGASGTALRWKRRRAIAA